jgi:hypothetical protein
VYYLYQTRVLRIPRGCLPRPRPLGWTWPQLWPPPEPAPEPLPWPKPWPRPWPVPPIGFNPPQDDDEDVKCCNYGCTDGLPYYKEIKINEKCPFAIRLPSDPSVGCALGSNPETPGKCPRNVPRPSPTN